VTVLRPDPDAAWPTRERILVCLGPSPASARLVRATRQIAGGMRAPWHAVYVDITGAPPLSAEDRDRVEAHLALAESLGGGVARLSGRSVAGAVLEFAREHGVTRIVAGKPTHSRWRDRLRGSLLDALIRGSGDIEIHVIAPSEPLPRRSPAIAAGPGKQLAGFVPGLVAVACATALGVAAGDRLSLPDDAMLFLFAIMVAALGGRGPGIAAAAGAVAAYDFFFVPPRYTFAVYDLQNLMTFAVMFTLGTAMGSLVARLRHAAIARLGLAAEAREAELRAKAEELRSSLLSTVSHDLRTPLAIITGTATALRDESPALTQGQLESLDTIVDEAKRLEKILTNLLAITRVESGAELHRDWVPVEELVGSALERTEAALSGRDVQIDLAADIGAEVDPILTEQLLLNLLENAAKHTPAEAPIEIRAFREAGGVAIEISDRGPGLPAGTEDQVFQKFFRGPETRAARVSRAAGAGLGLAVCRGIANAHGGTIDARRRTGGGATFHVWLPGGDAPAEGAAP